MFRIALSALLLVACSTKVPDIHSMQVVEEDSVQSAVVNTGTEKTYIPLVYRGDFSSEKIHYSSSSRNAPSSVQVSSSSTMEASSSSMEESTVGVWCGSGRAFDWMERFSGRLFRRG